MDHGEGPTGDGGDQQRSRGDEDKALVRWRIGAGAEGEKNERRKNQHIRYGNDVEKFRIQVWRAAMPDERIGSRQNAEDNHETRQQEARNAKAAVNVHTP